MSQSAFRSVPLLLMQVCGLLFFLAHCSPASGAGPSNWKGEWPNTDFSKRSIEWNEIVGGGPPKDGIQSIDRPRFAPPGSDALLDLGPREPVISLSIDGEARAYPLRILTRHEIVNDRLGGMPIAVTYCPLCNSSVVFDRRLDGRMLDFGTTGKLRNSDLVMYDRQTESWWQQFTGEAIVGELTGERLRFLPARVESYARFQKRYPDGEVLVPPARMPGFYRNPYVSYDTRSRPYPLFRGELPDDIEPMARVVAVGDRAWSLRSLSEAGRIEEDGLVLTWIEGQNSALDAGDISRGRDIGNVIVQRETGNGLVDIPYDVTFAFAFRAFHPEGELSDD